MLVKIITMVAVLFVTFMFGFFEGRHYEMHR